VLIADGMGSPYYKQLFGCNSQVND
jgi:hypothetical protein